MEQTYIRFKRPDGTIFNKLSSITNEAAEAYLNTGCVILKDDATAKPKQRAPKRPTAQPKVT